MMYHKFKEPFIMDYGNSPLVVNMERYSKANQNFRTAFWTGAYMQVTLMSIPVGESIGLERHGDTDQFIYVESGRGFIEIGAEKTALTNKHPLGENSAAIIPAGFWHNIKNTGGTPLKVFSIYSPPHHPFGTIHKTKKDAQEPR